MTLFQTLQSETSKRGLDFLVIGGLAVVFHGYSRDTADLDLLIRRERRPSWLEILALLEYKIIRDAQNFLQFSPPKKGAWPIDLMLVKGSSFDPMLATAIEVEMYGVRVRIPSLDHLLALKLHALKHAHLARYMKDFLDIEALVRTNGLDVKSEKIRQMFLKYGNLEIYEKISRAVGSQ